MPIVVACDHLLSYPFLTYLPLFAQIAKEEAKTQPFASVLNVFCEQYNNKTLTLVTVNNFFNCYRNNLYDLYTLLLLKANNKALSIININDLRPRALIELKNKALRNETVRLYDNSGEPINIITTCPYVQLITDCLAYSLPQGSFSVGYLSPSRNIESAISKKGPYCPDFFSLAAEREKKPTKSPLRPQPR